MAGLKFKVAKLVTVPLLKTPDNGTPIYVTITGAIFRAKDQTKAGVAETDVDAPPAANGMKQQPPELAHAINLETGEVCQIIVSTVLGTELRDTYPNDTYVGKSFEIKKFRMSGGKKYATFQIAEIEVEADEPAEKHGDAPATSGKAKK